MELGGEYLLQTDPETLWAALHDAELLARCVPGCERVEWVGADTLEAEIALRIGTAKRRYRGRVRVADARPHESYRLLFGTTERGSSVVARIRLEPHADATLFRYDVEARLDSYLARLGIPVAVAIARRIAGRFFKRLDVALADYAAATEARASTRP